MKKEELRSEYESTYLAYTRGNNYLSFEEWLISYKGYKPKNKTKQQLIDRVIENLLTDINCGDLTNLEELLTFLPTKNLIQSLNEDEWKLFKKIR